MPRSIIERDALRKVLLKVNQKLLEDQLDICIALFFTWKERERHRQEKANATRKLS